MVRVNKKGKAIGSSYLMDRWLRGENAGVFQSIIGKESEKIWNMDISARNACYQRWTRDFCLEQASILQNVVYTYNESYAQLYNARA